MEHTISCFIHCLHRLLRKTLLIQLFYPFMHPSVVLKRQRTALGQEVEERDLIPCPTLEVRHDAHLLHLVARELRLNLKRAYAVNLIPEEVDTVGILRRIGKHVDDATTHGKLPRLIHIVHTLKALARQRRLHMGYLHRVAYGKVHRTVVQGISRHHQLGQGIGVSDYI